MALSTPRIPANNSPRSHCRRIKIHKDAVDFCRIGGLADHLKTLREMIIIPLLQESVYSHFNIKAPRGVLFYGPPGTGKTMAAAAIATEINKEGIGKVAFFKRKGADILDKWVGGSEKNLRDLFEKATKTRPSIIFFDEIDGLAPVREKQHDQIHASVVATLLALMDGLDNKPGLIIIGATNRIEAVDPALRRPGRFDKELYFPLPGLHARKEILKVHVESWKHKPLDKLLDSLAQSTSGFSGADLQALCFEAVMTCMKRFYPSLRGVKADPEKLKVEECDFLLARSVVVPSITREGQKMRRLTPLVQPLLEAQLRRIVRSIQTFWPHFLQENHKYVIGEDRYAGRVLLIGTNSQGLNTHLVPAVLQTLEYLPSFVYDINIRQNIATRFRYNFPSIIVLSRVDEWWNYISECEQLSIVSNLEEIHAALPVLVIATCRSDVPYMLQEFFYNNSTIMLKVESSTEEERQKFFKPLFFDRSIVSIYSVLENMKRGEQMGHSSKTFNDCKMAMPQVSSRSRKRKSESKDVSKNTEEINRFRKRQKYNENDEFLRPSSAGSSLLQINQEQDSTEKECARRCDSDTSLTTITQQSFCLQDIFADLLNKRNSRYCDNPNNTQSAIKNFLCEKTPRSQSKRDLEIKAVCEKSSNGDPRKRDIYKLWKQTSSVTSRDMSVSQLELLYDVISACINIHWNSFDNLITNLEEILTNVEMTQGSEYSDLEN